MQSSSIKLLMIILLAIALLGIGWFVARHLLLQTIRKRLPELVLKRTDSLYALQLENVQLEMFRGNLSADSIRLQADTSHPDFGGQAITEFTLPHLQLENLSWRRLLLHRTIVVDKLLLEAPEILHHTQTASTPTDSIPPPDKPDSTAAKKKKRDFVVQLRSFRLEHGQLHVKQAQDSTLARIDTFDIQTQDIHWETAQSWQKQVAGLWADAQIRLEGMAMNLPNGLDALAIQSVYLAYADSLLQIDSISLMPLYPRIRYSEKYGYQKPRNEILIPELVLAQVDWPRLLSDRFLAAGSLRVRGLRIDAFKDKRRGFRPGHYVPAPKEAIKKLPLKFQLAHVSLREGSARYQEIAAGKRTQGSLFFTGLHADIQNLTNDSVLFRGETPTQINAKAYLQGKSPLHINWALASDAAQGRQRITGSMGPLELADMNGILKASANLGIKSGTVEGLSFDFTTYPSYSSGTVRLTYRDLKVDVLEELDYGKFRRKWLFTGAARLAVIPQNPDRKGRERVGVAYAVRDTRKSVFAFWWQSIFSGVQGIILREPAQKIIKKNQ